MHKHGARRRKCADCGKTFRVQNGTLLSRSRAAARWILDRSPLRRIAVKTGHSHVSEWKKVQSYAGCIPSPLERCRARLRKASHILLLDGKHVRIAGRSYCIHIAYDTALGVVDYWIDVTENKTAYAYLFQRLGGVGYHPLCIVSDGHWGILSLVWEHRLPHQRCIFHLLRELKWRLTGSFLGEFSTPKNRLPYSRIRNIFKTKRIEDLPLKIELFRRFQRAFTGQKKIFRWLWGVLESATTHLSWEPGHIPATSNDLERVNGQIEARLKTFRGIKSEKSLNNLLKILFRFRHYK